MSIASVGYCRIACLCLFFLSACSTGDDSVADFFSEETDSQNGDSSGAPNDSTVTTDGEDTTNTPIKNECLALLFPDFPESASNPYIQMHQWCDDLNSCTYDFCTEIGACTNTLITCYQDDPCMQGTCNPTSGSCEYTKILTCDDGDLCTDDLQCDPEFGCSLPSKPIDVKIVCFDGEPCTFDMCDKHLGCQNIPIECDDGDECTQEYCNEGTCVEKILTCQDGNICTADYCQNGSCVHIYTDCDDGIDCTETTCVDFIGCKTKLLHNLCDDGVYCTSDTCDIKYGCLNIPNHTCDDSNPCTFDFCSKENDCSNIPIECDDTDPCTQDECDPLEGCLHTTLDECP